MRDDFCGNILTWFQLALPRRERPTSTLVRKLTPIVSTRAPAKGATCNNVDAVLLKSCFNSRSREGSDSLLCLLCFLIKMFQLALPRRERQQLYARFFMADKFQLALPRRERHDDRQAPAYAGMFQLALPRRERLVLSPFLPSTRRFNSRSREGSDL